MSYFFKRAGISYVLWTASVVAILAYAATAEHRDAVSALWVCLGFGLLNGLASYDIDGWRKDRWLRNLAANRNVLARIAWWLFLIGVKLLSALALIVAEGLTYKYATPWAVFMLVVTVAWLMQEIVVRTCILAFAQDDTPVLGLREYIADHTVSTFPTFSKWLKITAPKSS